MRRVAIRKAAFVNAIESGDEVASWACCLLAMRNNLICRYFSFLEFTDKEIT
jgi:hypothetical protein